MNTIGKSISEGDEKKIFRWNKMYLIILFDTLVAENYFIKITREINGKYFDFYSAIFHSLLHNVYRSTILFVLSSVYFITVEIISPKLTLMSSTHENDRHSYQGI